LEPALRAGGATFIALDSAACKCPHRLRDQAGPLQGVRRSRNAGPLRGAAQAGLDNPSSIPELAALRKMVRATTSNKLASVAGPHAQARS